MTRNYNEVLADLKLSPDQEITFQVLYRGGGDSNEARRNLLKVAEIYNYNHDRTRDVSGFVIPYPVTAEQYGLMITYYRGTPMQIL